MTKEDGDGAAPAVRPDTGTVLALQRTYLASERTQMAWVRTALALISFGFTIAKFFEYLHDKEGANSTLFGSRSVGVLMIAIGLIAMSIALAQHRRAIVSLRRQWPEMPVSIAGGTSFMILVLGLCALIGALLR